jgi:hypothetical protein
MSKQKFLYNTIICLVVLSSGCIKIKSTPVPVVAVQGTSEAQTIANAMKDVSQEDCILMYKQFSGLVAYLENTQKIDNTIKMERVLDTFKTDYSYTKKKYADYDAAVKAFLEPRGYKQAKKIVDTVEDGQESKQISRSTVINDIKVLAEAAKIASGAKNAK